MVKDAEMAKVHCKAMVNDAKAAVYGPKHESPKKDSYMMMLENPSALDQSFMSQTHESFPHIPTQSEPERYKTPVRH